MLGMKSRMAVKPALQHRAAALHGLRIARRVIARAVVEPAAADTPEAPAAAAPATASSRRAPRQDRPGSDARQPRQDRPVSGFIVRLETKPRGLANSILASELLAQSETKPEVVLKMTCIRPEAVSRAIMAIAYANLELAEKNSPFRIQAASAVKRETGEGVYQALQGGQFNGLLFLSKVPVSSLVPATDPKAQIRVSRSTVWTKLARHVQMSFTENHREAVTLLAAGQQQLGIIFQAMIMSRYQIIRGERDQERGASSEAGDSPAATTPTTPQQRKDFVFVPSLVVQSADDGKELTVCELHLQRCALRAKSDEMRMVTPRPARSRAESPRPTRERTGARRNSNGETVTVAVSEWNSMKERLDAMVAQHEQLVKLLAADVSTDKGQHGSK